MADATVSGSKSRAMRLWEDHQWKALAHAQQAGRCAAWVMDAKSKEVNWQPDGYEIFGRPFAEFTPDKPFIELVETDDQQAIVAAFERTAETGQPLAVEYRLHWPNGELHWQEARGLLDPEVPNLIRGTTFDVTARKRAESTLLGIEKLASVGRIASTIAHEINNPLESVTNLIYLALTDDSLPEQTRAYLVTAQEQLGRLSNISRLTLSFARTQGTERVIPPAEVVDNVLYIFRHKMQATQMEVCVEPQTQAQVRLYVDELQRILTNLIANALDAAPKEGGKLHISIVEDGPEIQISLQDNGSGIPPEHADRIFEAFFTTKEDTGTGIGLFVTKELVEKNGGSISFHSGELEGGMKTRFDLRFPVAMQIGEA
jgi:signal transduction histidine kinase